MIRPLHFAFAVSAAAALATAWPVSGARVDSAPTPKVVRSKTPVAHQQATGQKVDKLIVKLRGSRTQVRAAALSADRVQAMSTSAGVGMKALRAMAGGSHLMQLDSAMTLDEARAAAARIAQDPNVEYAEPNVRFRALFDPNDSRYMQWQWNLFSPTSSYTGQAGAATVTATAAGGANLPPAWDRTTGSSAVIVAIIDTGIVNHPELSGRVLPGYDFVSSANGAGLPANFVANDGDGPDADPSDPGDWVTVEEKTLYPDECATGETAPYTPFDSSWHGTHIAGVAAAMGNNNAGIAGVAWNVQVVPVRALGKCGGDLSDIAEAIRWAAGLPVGNAPMNANPAHVINLSLGGGDTCGPTMQAAVDAAIAAGAVIIAATGNDGNVGMIAPANCNGVVAVTAHSINGENASYANIGAGTTLSAPGGGPPTSLGAGSAIDNAAWDGYYIYSTVLFGPTTPTSVTATGDSGPAYAGFVGTSPAAPQVAGVAALVKSLAPDATPAFIKAWLGMSDRVRPHPIGGYCYALVQECGRGLLDAEKAVQGAIERIPAVEVNASARVVDAGGTVTFTAAFTAFPGKSIQTAVWSTTAGTLSASTGTTATLTLPTGYAEVSLTATDNEGKVARDSIIVRVNRAPSLLAVQDQSAAVGQIVSFDVTATDADNDPVSFSAESSSTVPLQSLDSAGRFNWNTTGFAAGTYQLTYSASDGLANSATQTVTITLTTPAGGGGGGSSAVPPASSGGGGALPGLQLLLLGALLFAPTISQRKR